VAGIRARPGRARYAGTLIAFAASLMAKPMLVTLPVLLLLLDWWPLGRIGGAAADGRPRFGWRDAIVEKLPLAAVAAAAVIVAVSTQHRGENVSGVDAVPIAFRAGHTLVAYVTYLRGRSGRAVSPYFIRTRIASMPSRSPSPPPCSPPSRPSPSATRGGRPSSSSAGRGSS